MTTTSTARSRTTRSRTTKVRNAALATILAVAVFGCSTGGDDEPTGAGITIADPEDTTTSVAPSDDLDDGTAPEQPAAETISVDDPRLSDGIWEVGDAGTVEFTVDEGGLTLVDTIANDGWATSVDVDAADEIEVEFRRDEQEYTIEIELDDGILEIEIDLDIDPAEPGTFAIGPAATAELAVDGDAVTLVDLSVTDGWDVTERDEDDGEVDVQLRQGNVTWDFDAEVDDGRLQVQIDFEIEGMID